MPRQRRLLIPGIPAHVRIRGNDGQAIFRTEGDRIFLHRCLLEAARRFGATVHAYVFMTNHIHLLATGERAESLSKLAQALGRRYVGYFNYLHGRSGTLWEGRFRSCLVESDRYFLVCHRYVELNPVRAGMVGHPGEFRWSSYRCNALGKADDLVSPHSLYMELARADDARRAAYRGLFDENLDAPTLAAIRRSTDKGWALGGPEFRAMLEARSGRPMGPRKVGRPRKRGRRAVELAAAVGAVGAVGDVGDAGDAGDAGVRREIPAKTKLESDPNYSAARNSPENETGV